MPKTYSPGHLTGMLLEEAVLFLLRGAGYRTVMSAEDDPTLHNGRSGLEVKGRGSRHQIDAVADYIIPQPFSNQSRLLVEAKCYTSPVGVEVIRNCVSVLKDVQEYWVPAKGKQSSRYHYQSAVVSASNFTKPAQQFAFAHDIYLIPLGESKFFEPLLAAIKQCGEDGIFELIVKSYPVLKDLRSKIRRTMQKESGNNISSDLIAKSGVDALQHIDTETQKLASSLLAVVGQRFPIFLTPAPNLVLKRLHSTQKVTIHPGKTGWHLKNIQGEPLFSFDLPQEIFSLYRSQGGYLSPQNTLSIKRDYLAVFKAIVVTDGRARVINFEVDRNWLDTLLRRKQEQQ